MQTNHVVWTFFTPRIVKLKKVEPHAAYAKKSERSVKMIKYTSTDYLPYHSLTEDGIVLWKGTAETIEKKHIHEFIEITYIFSGKGIHKINGVSYPVSKGNLLFINYNNTHYFEPIEPLTYCNIILLPEFISTELINSENAMDMLMLSTFNDLCADIKSIRPFLYFQGKAAKEIENLIEEMIDEFENKEKSYRSVLKSLLTVLLVKIFRKMQLDDNIGTIKQTGKSTLNILEYIEKNCFEKISINDLAKKCFYNPSYFSRIFKECYGITLTAYIQEQRITKAQQLLIESDMSINKICSYVGYNDKTQFYKIFKKYSDGLLPNEYRKKFSTAISLKRESCNQD